MARNGVPVRPLTEDALILKTYMACRANNKSKAASELVRAFMRKLSHQGMKSNFRSQYPRSTTVLGM
jgi:hypothetical protein